MIAFTLYWRIFMGIQLIAIIFFLILCIVTNIITYLKVSKKNDSVSDESRLQAQIILMDRKVSDMRQELKDISEKIDSRVSKTDTVEVVELDELTSYFKSNMKITDMAKKMNKSVKEIELMLKLKGLI